MKNKRVIIPLILVAAIAVWALLLHPPYFKPYTDWMEYKGQQYRLEAWHSNTPLLHDRVRFVLRHKNGGFAAVSPGGYVPDAQCKSLDDCTVFLRRRSGKDSEYDFQWRHTLDPAKVIHVPDAASAQTGSPDGWTGTTEAFAQGGTRDNRVLANVCFTNLVSVASWQCGLAALYVALLMGVYAWRRRRVPHNPPKPSRYAVAAVLTPVLGAIALELALAKVYAYQDMLESVGFALVYWLPVLAVSGVVYWHFMKRAQPAPLRKCAAALVVFGVLCLAFPFIQTAMQAKISDGPMTQINASQLVLEPVKEFK